MDWVEGDVAVKNISELIARSPEEHEIFYMPDARIIGSVHRCTFEDDSAGVSPHQEYWGGNYYTYMPGVICPANTPVPDGLDFRDLPASFVAKGIYGDQANMMDVITNIKQLGFTTCYMALGWNVKLFLGDDEKTKRSNTPCRWLVPCIKIDGN